MQSWANGRRNRGCLHRISPQIFVSLTCRFCVRCLKKHRSVGRLFHPDLGVRFALCLIGIQRAFIRDPSFNESYFPCQVHNISDSCTKPLPTTRQSLMSRLYGEEYYHSALSLINSSSKVIDCLTLWMELRRWKYSSTDAFNGRRGDNLVKVISLHNHEFHPNTGPW